MIEVKDLGGSHIAAIHIYIYRTHPGCAVHICVAEVFMSAIEKVTSAGTPGKWRRFWSVCHPIQPKRLANPARSMDGCGSVWHIYLHWGGTGINASIDIQPKRYCLVSGSLIYAQLTG